MVVLFVSSSLLDKFSAPVKHFTMEGDNFFLCRSGWVIGGVVSISLCSPGCSPPRSCHGGKASFALCPFPWAWELDPPFSSLLHGADLITLL